MMAMVDSDEEVNDKDDDIKNDYDNDANNCGGGG
jgi:hypothetical protein